MIQYIRRLKHNASTLIKSPSKIQRDYSSDKSFSIIVDEFDLPKSEFSTLLSTHKTQRAIEKRPFTYKKSSMALKPTSSEKVVKNPRISSLNIQMLSSSLHEQIFKTSSTEPNEELINIARHELKKHGLWQDKVDCLPDVDLKLPQLEGENIEEHFKIIGDRQARPYKDLLLNLIKQDLPPIPNTFLMNPGWTMYKHGEEPQAVDCPLEDALVFDVEVCKSVGEAPTLATAASTHAWYAWVSSELADNSNPVVKQQYFTKDFIPMESRKIESDRPRVIVGHNVSYDRARIKEQYYITNSYLRFVDTMSLHICIGGVTSYQRSMLKSNVPGEDDTWRQYSSLNSLKEVYKLYCKKEMSKEERNIFVEGSLEDVRQKFHQLVKYCANDVLITFEVLQKLAILFFERFPHPVTFAGMLEMGTAYLPINNNWARYLSDSQQTFEDFENEAKTLLIKKCDNACQLLHDEKYKSDLWMWSEKWDTQELKITKKKKKKLQEKEEVSNDEAVDELDIKFKYLFDLEDNLPVKSPHLPGYPIWYRKLCEKEISDEWIPGPQLVSTGVKVTPKILNLTWENYPLYHMREHGWGLLVADLNINDDPETDIPYNQLKELTLKNNQTSQVIECAVEEVDQQVEQYNSKHDYWENKPNRETPYKGIGIWCNEVVDSCCYFIKLPHKDGTSNNVGNPLAKDFLKTFNSSILSSPDASAEKILNINRMLTYWRNNCERIWGQLAVWLLQKDLPRHLRSMDQHNFGAILPQVVVCGTLTRRAMEPTWMTASNAMKERIGSELRSMVQAPPGYKIVGADVDSQELWIASMIGDAYFARTHGATPFGWMTLSGHKAKGTDMHSMTAKAAGITRDHAKVINYARMYGAGHKFTQRLLKQFNPSMSDQEAKSKATKMLLLTKGQKKYKIKPEMKELLPDTEDFQSSFSAIKIAKQLGKPVTEIFEKACWLGGTESAMFNRLEEIATSRKPVTPFLSGRLTRALETRFEGDESYLTTKINWVVQSGAVDFLHLMLVCMRWLTNGQVRFCLSFHDEVRYLVEEDKKYQAALALHITNLLTRSFCAHRLQLYDLPQSVAFFTSVEVDSVLRKESNHDCTTPSNPHGLNKGYGIPFGESLNIYDTLNCTGGSLKVFHSKKKIRYICV